MTEIDINKNIIYLRTDEVSKLVTLFDVLKDNFNEVTLDFLAGGIKILELDEHQTMLSYIKLDSNKFSKYHSRFTIYKVGIDLIQLHKFFKTIKQNGTTLEIFINENVRNTIVFETTHNSTKSRYTQPLLLIDKPNQMLPLEATFDFCATIPTNRSSENLQRNASVF